MRVLIDVCLSPQWVEEQERQNPQSLKEFDAVFRVHNRASFVRRIATPGNDVDQASRRSRSFKNWPFAGFVQPA